MCGELGPGLKRLKVSAMHSAVCSAAQLLFMAQASGDQAKLILYEMMYIVRVLKDRGQKLALKQESGSKVR